MQCSRCGERTSAGDLEPTEVAAMAAGHGCPECRWGTFCPRCEATGREPCARCAGVGATLAADPCAVCGGSGFTSYACAVCAGSGTPHVHL